MKVTIERFTKNAFPQLGIVSLDEIPFCFSLELPDKNNEKLVSCIPSGKYICRRTFNRKTTGRLLIDTTFEVLKVPNRSGILFHVGNYMKDTNGCILLGQRVDFEKFCVLDSTKAFTQFITKTRDVNEFLLEIYESRF